MEYIQPEILRTRLWNVLLDRVWEEAYGILVSLKLFVRILESPNNLGHELVLMKLVNWDHRILSPYQVEYNPSWCSFSSLEIVTYLIQICCARPWLENLEAHDGVVQLSNIHSFTFFRSISFGIQVTCMTLLSIRIMHVRIDVQICVTSGFDLGASYWWGIWSLPLTAAAQPVCESVCANISSQHGLRYNRHMQH